MAKDDTRPIILKRRKKAAHQHHGGSWKVAYADFVTAMMAFFMVMWILGMDENTRKAVEGYFTDPTGFKKGYGAGQSPVAIGSTPLQMKEDQIRIIIRGAEKKAFSDAAGRIKHGLESQRTQLGSAKFEVTVTEEGLRVELIEGAAEGQFFESGSATVTPVARLGLTIIAHELAGLRNPVVVEGHTDAAPYPGGVVYTNWELSADRANAARRVLEETGLQAGRVAEVRGYADTQLRRPEAPMAAENRRISLLLPFSRAPESKSAPADSNRTVAVSKSP
ncbi:MAG: flagellar motor protein MotB [Gemmatimonas sp.]|nr:flagellar motor protein MotB [Gemmatimonas sp.]